MEELFLPAFSDVADGTLCRAVLEVGVDPAEGESLLPLRAVVSEGVVVKSAVVCVVVFDLHGVVGGELFER